MDERCFVGIDPGLHGGLALLDAEGDAIGVAPMPLAAKEIDPVAVRDWILQQRRGLAAFVGCVAIEKVHSMPKQGGASTFRFGYGLGLVVGAVAIAGWRYEMVPPPRWKKAILRDTDRSKEAAIAYCQRRWPSTSLVLPRCRKPHDGIADALCLAEYGWRLWKRGL